MIIIKHPDHGTVTVTSMPQYGIEKLIGEDDTIPNVGPTVEFKLFDDDGGFCYGGTLTDDDEALNQVAALRYGESDYGATRIEVKRDGTFIQEIG